MISSNILKGENVRLNALSKDDLPKIAEWSEDTDFGRLMDAVPAVPKSEAQWSSWLDDIEKDKDSFFLAIRHIEGDELLGYIELDGILWTHQSGWLAIGLGSRENWGKGFGREAIELALKFAFHELNLFRLQLTVFEYNERAIALYERVGFVREGVNREMLNRDGRRYDLILYGLLRREWEARQQPLI